MNPKVAGAIAQLVVSIFALSITYLRYSDGRDITNKETILAFVVIFASVIAIDRIGVVVSEFLKGKEQDSILSEVKKIPGFGCPVPIILLLWTVLLLLNIVLKTV